jgi:hypothetical protein
VCDAVKIKDDACVDDIYIEKFRTLVENRA